MQPLARSLLVALALASIVMAQAAGAGNAIAWSKDLPTAFAAAKKQQKIIMICVNAKYVDGRKKEESANKGLREIVYRDERVIAASSHFVCALITPASGSSEIGELRLLGIEGALVAPQHIFVHPDGGKILLRKQYWSHGKGEPAVKALLALMRKAHEKLDGASAEPDPGEPEPQEAAPTGEKRPAWIQDRIKEVIDGPRKTRVPAIEILIRSDKDGDCTTPLIALLTEHKKDVDLIIDLIRGLGQDGLHDASLPIVAFLTHKEVSVRGNAAVSLEYIGTRDKKLVAALLRAAGKDKDQAMANHMYRAAGRCGVGDSKARSTLLKKCAGAKSEFASYGPTIALAYFEGDKKAARGMEKLLKKIGVPGGRRGGGQNTVKRGVYCWTLASIGDAKSGDFMREELLAKLEHVQAFWVGGLKSFYRTVARVCDGEKAAMPGVRQGVRGFVGFAKGANPDRYNVEARSLMDACRKFRKEQDFVPRGDYLLGDGVDE